MRLRQTDDIGLPRAGALVGLDRVLADLDRLAQRWVVPARNLVEGYRWERADVRDREWWPQGVTTSCDAGTDAPPGRRIIAVSWYAKAVGDAPSRGSRVSLIDVTDPVRARYRHIELVEPRSDPQSGGARLEPVRVHVGGLAWLGGALLVADTRGGLRVFDFDTFLTIDGTGGESRYALPQRRAYRAENDQGAQPFRFSFLSVDRSGSGPELVVGEYGTGDRPKRLMRWALTDDARAPLALTDGLAVPLSAECGVGHTQGALIVDGHRYASVSRGRFRRGSVWTWPEGGRPREHRAALAVGPEDLSYCADRDEIWNVTEHPGRRYIYAIRRAPLEG